MESGLAGLTVLITGASGGIGAATAAAFAAEGAKLILHAHRHEAKAFEVARALDVEALVVRADLRDEAGIDRMYEQALDRFGRVDALVANAGIWPPDDVPVHEMTIARWRETVETDLTGTFLTCRAFLRHLADAPRETASIVLVGSTAALFGEAGHADYAAAKAGVVYGLTRSLKNEIVRLAPHARVNAVCPGWTRTPMTEGDLDNAALLERVQSTMALKRIAAAADVARVIVFLSSPRLAAHVTGAILPVAGGMEGRLVRD